MTKIQWATIAVIILYVAHEAFYIPWFSVNSQGAVIRADLVYIYPIILILVVTSAWQYFRKK